MNLKSGSIDQFEQFSQFASLKEFGSMGTVLLLQNLGLQ
jgi:hypothetical protein